MSGSARSPRPGQSEALAADPLTASLVALARPRERPQVVAEIARLTGATALLLLVPDAEGRLLSAPGLPKELPQGQGWASLLERCRTAGVHQAEVDWPGSPDPQPATALAQPDGSVFIFVGPDFSLERVDSTLFPLVGAMLRAEQASLAASGAARAAREAAQNATALNTVLDATRGDLQKALEEAARLNRELARAVTGESLARAEAEAANRAKDEFLAMLGHELRNPLAPIVTALHLLRLRHGESRELNIIERQITHVVRLVDDLLDVSRIIRGKIELQKAPAELGRVAAQAVEMASPLLEQNQHHFIMDVPTEGLKVEADEDRLAQVLANLLTNAARYTPPGGEIRLSACAKDDLVEVSVSDSGIGIDPSMLPRIFDLFVQGKRQSDRAEGGLGLGLALVRNLVTMHGGTVEAQSEGPGKGSTFIVRLPRLLDEPPVEAKPPARTQPIPTGPPLRVLVVDDNADAAQLLAELLRMYGHTVQTASDGPGALRQIDDFRPDVAILDIGLPVMDGYELARQLTSRPELEKLRLIALSGYGLAQDRARANAAGFHGHLTKPVAIEDLLEALTPH